MPKCRNLTPINRNTYQYSLRAGGSAVSMRYVLGVDGGQTSTLAVIADEKGQLLGVGHGGPANHLHEVGGIERVRTSLSNAIKNALLMAELNHVRLSAACLGMTGGGEEMNEVCTPVVPADQIIFGPDTHIALYSVTFGLPGVVVISGTGSSAYGLTQSGRHASAGGWGYQLGDEGSGYWIAMRALNVCCRAADGVIPNTTHLLNMILQRLEVDNLNNIHNMIYSGKLIRPDIASLSESVGFAALQGDSAAIRILREAGRELAAIVNAVVMRLELQNEPITIGTVGGVFRSGRLALRSFRESIKKIAPNSVIIGPRVPSAVGAALIALEGIGVKTDNNMIANLQFSIQHMEAMKS